MQREGLPKGGLFFVPNQYIIRFTNKLTVCSHGVDHIDELNAELINILERTPKQTDVTFTCKVCGHYCKANLPVIFVPRWSAEGYLFDVYLYEI